MKHYEAHLIVLLRVAKSKEREGNSPHLYIGPLHAHPIQKTGSALCPGQGCQKFRAQVAANFTKSRGIRRKSSPIFPQAKMHPKCLNLGALCVKLTKNHPNGRKNNRLSNFRKLRIITFEAFRWLYMTS